MITPVKKQKQTKTRKKRQPSVQGQKTDPRK